MNLSTVKWAQWDKTQSRELSGLFICVCSSLYTIVAHNTAQNRPDNFPSCPPDNHHCSDDVYLRERVGVWPGKQDWFNRQYCCFSGAPSYRSNLTVVWRKRFRLHWQTGHRTRLTWTLWTVQSGAPFSSSSIPSKINDVDHLKQLLISCWDTIRQELINAAIDQWSKRLLLVIRSQDEHIEHRLHWFRRSVTKEPTGRSVVFCPRCAELLASFVCTFFCLYILKLFPYYSLWAFDGDIFYVFCTA